MIIDVVKYLFVGVPEDLDHFFEKAQKEGFIQFIPSNKKKGADFPQDVQDLINALKALRKQPKMKEFERVERDPKEVTERILYLKNTIDALYEEQRILDAEILRIAPLGDFSLEEIRKLEHEGHRKVQFFCVKTAKRHKEKLGEDLIYLNTEYDLDYFMSVDEKVRSFPGMIEMRIERSLGELKNRYGELKDSIHNYEGELKEHAGYIHFLKMELTRHFNTSSLDFAKTEVTKPLEGALFSVEAWVPKNRRVDITKLLEDFKIFAEEIAIEKSDRVPTYMENKKLGSVGEDLVRIYDIPATDDKDPSRWVLTSFAIFFAMIISDAGYGMIFLTLALFLRFKFTKLEGMVRRLVTLLTVLASTCIIWGVLTGSYFGLDLAPGNPVNKVSMLHHLSIAKADYHMKMKDDVYEDWIKKYPQLKDAKTGEQFLSGAIGEKEGHKVYEVVVEFHDNILIEIAILAGIIHVALSLLRYFRRHIAGLGWVAAMLGGYLFFPSMLQATSMVNFLGLISKPFAEHIGIQLLYGGMGLAFLLAFIQCRVRGFAEIAKIIEIFADVLSYLRLYALALAGMILAATFNGIGKELGYVGGFFVILIGHCVNITLSTMGGVIHGLRLNFIEWYHYSFEGGGKTFNPLKLLKIK